ncbi:hypothetical protein GCM10027066_18850 [Dyella jejuensis]
MELTVTEVPSLHCTVILPDEAACCAYTPGAAIKAAASTAINPNDFIVIPSVWNAPIRENAPSVTAGFPLSLQPEATLPNAVYLQRLRRQLCPKSRRAGTLPGTIQHGQGAWFTAGCNLESGRATAYIAQLIWVSKA